MQSFKTLVATLGLLAATATMAAAADLEITYNGKSVSLDQPAIIQDGRTLLSLRDMADDMNIAVSWDKNTRIASVDYKDKHIQLQPDLKRVLINGVEQQVEVGPQIINDRIYLPLRYLFEMLGGTVYYRAYDDHAVVAVNSYDSYSSYQTVIGTNEYKVVRKAPMTTAGTVFIDHSGMTQELYIKDNKLTSYRTAAGFNNYTTKEYEYNGFENKAYTLVRDPDNVYQLILSDLYQTGQVGDMIYPDESDDDIRIETPQGEFRLLRGFSTLKVLDLEGIKGFHDRTISDGYLLDLGSYKIKSKDKDYAKDGANTYAFLTDGQLLIVNASADTSQRGAKAIHTLSNTMKSGKVYYSNGKFGAIGIDTAANGKQELFIATTSPNGMLTYSYRQISNFTSLETYRGLFCLDSTQLGDNVYTLLQIGTNYYLATWNMATNDFTTTKMDKAYTRFVQVKDTMQAMAYDEDYYYFYKLQ